MNQSFRLGKGREVCHTASLQQEPESGWLAPIHAVAKSYHLFRNEFELLT